MSEDKYTETLEQLYFTTRSLLAQERQEETAIGILNDLRAVINDFSMKVDTLQGERKVNALKTIQTLKKSI